MTTDVETKVFRFPTEIKAVDAEARTFEGLASTWNKDLQDDIIERGAFRKTLSSWRKGDRVIPLLDSHDAWSIRSALGRLENAQEREAGLWTKWKIVSGEDGDGALARIEDGIVDSLSIGYRATKWGMEEDEEARYGEIRRIKELELKEVSLVMFPANPEARISAVKSLIERLGNREKDELRRLLEEPPKKSSSETYDSEAAAALSARLSARLFARRLAPLTRR